MMRLKHWKYQVLILLAFLSTHSLYAQQELDSLFNLGVKALSENNFNAAKQLLIKDIENNPSYESYYNLGITYGGLEDWNAAFWAFESALKIKPNDTEVAFNARLALEHINSKISWNHPYSWSKRIILNFPITSWFLITFLCAVGVGVTLYFLIILNKKNQRYSLIRTIFIIMIPLFLVSYFSGTTAKKHFENVEYVIPISENVITYVAMNGIALNETLKNGMRYQFIKESEGWVQIKFSDNRPVWVKKDEVGCY